MAVEFTPNVISSGYNLSKLNENFTKIDTALQDAVSLSGTTPNSFTSSLDLNSNDLLNVGTISATNITVGGVDYVERAEDAADRAEQAAESVGNIVQYSQGEGETFEDGVDYTAGTTDELILNALVITNQYNLQVYQGRMRLQPGTDYTLSNDGANTTVSFTDPIPVGVTHVQMVYGVQTSDITNDVLEAVDGQDLDVGDLDVAGNITVSGTVDGRDLAVDGTKLDGVETGADVTDTANVTSAGALMDSELTDIAAVKALDQGVATTDDVDFASITTTGDVTATGSLTVNQGSGDAINAYRSNFAGIRLGVDDDNCWSFQDASRDLVIQDRTSAVQTEIYRYNTSESQHEVTGDVTFSGEIDASVGGIKLGGTAAANLLDDYEEGTWTVTTSATGYTVSSQTGRYTKIGRLVTITGQVTFSAVNGSNNSIVLLAGIPFTPAITTTGICRESTANGDLFAANVTVSNQFYINSFDGVATGTNQVLLANKSYAFTITYEAA